MSELSSRKSYSVRPILLTAAAAALVLAVVTLLNGRTYLIFTPEVYLPLHTFAEIGSVVISFSIFALYWNTDEASRDSRGLFIGTAFLAVAIIDSMHLLSFPGMPLFVTPSSTEKGIYYWLSARIWVAFVLLVAIFIDPRSRHPMLRLGPLLALNLAIAAAPFVAVSFFSPSLPAVFVLGQGLTPLKNGLEYLVAATCAVSAVLYARLYRRSGDRFSLLMASALSITAVAGLCFTLYASAYDTYNLLGHVFKDVGYYLVFSAAFSLAVRRPYRELAELNYQIDNRLKVTIAQLKETSEAERGARERAEAAIELLRPLQTVAEAALSDKVLHALLQQLLDGIRRVLAADTARLLLLDQDGRDLVVRASSGLEEINTEEIRIPMGKGVAGRIAAAGQAQLVDDLSQAEVVRPLFRERVRSLIGAPLFVNGEVAGVVHVGAHTAGHFNQDDLRLLTRVAEGVASALERARLYGQLDATVTAIPNGVMVYAPSGQIMRMNPAAEAMFAYSPAELELPVGERLSMLLMEEPDGTPVPVEAAPLMRALRGEFMQNEVLIIQRPHKGRIWLSISTAPIRLDERGNLGAVITLTDVTEIHELQSQRSEHVLGISHGLRTPLTVIQGQAQLLEQSMKPSLAAERDVRSVRAIVAQSRRMSLVLRDLVDLTHLEAGQNLRLNFQPVEMESFVTDLLARLDGVLETCRVRVESPGNLPPVVGDPDRLERILANLLSNALKYSSPGSEVTIGLSTKGSRVTVAIADRGAGISDEKLATLFQRYRRRQIHAGASESLGLGLYISKGLVEAHGGQLWVTTMEGEGSTFAFSLPVANGEWGK